MPTLTKKNTPATTPDPSTGAESGGTEAGTGIVKISATKNPGARLPSEAAIIKTIQGCHSKAIRSAIDSVKEAAKAGAALKEAKEMLTIPFRQWIEENFPFAWRTAYRYIKLADLEASGSLDFDSVTSINEALKLGETSEKQEKEKGDDDERAETFVSHALKIEAWFIKETSVTPVADWPLARRRACKDLLEGVKSIFDQLIG